MYNPVMVGKSSPKKKQTGNLQSLQRNSTNSLPKETGTTTKKKFTI